MCDGCVSECVVGRRGEGVYLYEYVCACASIYMYECVYVAIHSQRVGTFVSMANLPSEVCMVYVCDWRKSRWEEGREGCVDLYGYVFVSV